MNGCRCTRWEPGEDEGQICFLTIESSVAPDWPGRRMGKNKGRNPVWFTSAERSWEFVRSVRVLGVFNLA